VEANSILQSSSTRRGFLHTAAVGAGALTTLSATSIGRLLPAMPQGSPSQPADSPTLKWLRSHKSQASTLHTASHDFIKLAGPFYDEMKRTENIPSNHKTVAKAMRDFGSAMGSLKTAVSYQMEQNPHVTQPDSTGCERISHALCEEGYMSLRGEDVSHLFADKDLLKGTRAIAKDGLGYAVNYSAEVIEKGWDQEGKNLPGGAHIIKAGVLSSLGSFMEELGEGEMAVGGVIAAAGTVLAADVADPETAAIGAAAVLVGSDIIVGGGFTYIFGYLIMLGC
jgi:hypothetical protein